jgi:tetratricopeptide (TPR) repeat protein
MFVSTIVSAKYAFAQRQDDLNGGNNHPLTASLNRSKTPSAIATTSTNPAFLGTTAGAAEATCGDNGVRTSLDMVAPRAEAHNKYALDLAERGAVESAQSEFKMALELVAGALDADARDESRAHARSLRAGLEAIEESKDFASSDVRAGIETNVAQIAAIHHTPVLKQAGAANVTRAEALQRYHAYAAQQLAFAGGHSPIASSAFYGLGRAESISTAGASTHNPLGGPNAIALYQAALYVDPQNYMAANELGVLMARYGDMEAAESQLRHSVDVHPQPETWHNLSAVYRAMGKSDEAARADAEREKLLAAARANGNETTGNGGASRPMVRWVDAETFASTGTPYGMDGPPINAATSTNAPQDSYAKRLVTKFIPWQKTNKSTAPQNESPTIKQADSSSGGVSSGRRLFR